MLRKNLIGFLNAERHPFAVSVAGGVVLGASFLSPLLWWLSLVALVPLFSLVHSPAFSPRKIFWYGWVYGFSFIGTVHLWIWQTLPLSWTGALSPSWGIALAFLCWFSVSLAQSFFIACFSVVASRIRQHSQFHTIFAVAALWVLLEYARMWGIAIFTWGEGSVLSPHYSVGFLGYALAPHDLLRELASIGGVYLLSFTVVCINGLVWALAVNRSGRGTAFTVALMVFILATTPARALWGKSVEDGAVNIRSALFHTNFTVTTLNTPLEMRAEKLKTHWSLLYELNNSGEKPAIVVVPETGRFLSTLKNAGALDSLVSESGLSETLFVDSSRAEDGATAKEEIWYFTPKQGTPLVQEKYFLIPFGEYLPYYYSLPLRILNQRQFSDFAQHRNYRAGGEKILRNVTGVPAGARACSEILSPSLYSDSTLAGAKILVNVASHGVFHNSKIMHYQALSIARIRAVENNRYLLRASNLSPAFVIDNHGRIVNQSAWGDTGVLFSSVYLIDEHSPYNKLRQWIESVL